MREVADLADVYARRLDDLKPPYWARRESDNHVTALKSLSTGFDKSAKRLGTPITSMAEANGLDANISRAYRTERKAIEKLLKGIGAIPTVPGSGGEESPAGEEEQSA